MEDRLCCVANGDDEFRVCSCSGSDNLYKMNIEQPQEILVMDINIKQPDQPRMGNYYFDMSLNNICRLCLGKNQGGKKMCNIFENSKMPHFSIMIMACASVQVLEGDGLPSMICNRCIGFLNIAWQFKQQCEHSDAKLRQYFGNSQHLQITPDLDGFNIGIKEEHTLFNLQSEPLLPPLQSNAQETVEQAAPSAEPVNQLLVQDMQQTETEPVKKDTNKPVLAENKAEKIKPHQCDTCGKTFNRREYLTQHIRIHTGEKPYRCHLCEKRFINSGHLTTHMRTHTGEKPHACTLCPKAFSTRQELTKHNMVHSGERPFICKLCGKRFGSSSNLYSHQKHHTGEKNFTCEHCGKAFYTKQELKQHFVVHTGEKAFLCEFCNKRFSQIAHLRRHSKLHVFRECEKSVFANSF